MLFGKKKKKKAEKSDDGQGGSGEQYSALFKKELEQLNAQLRIAKNIHSSVMEMSAEELSGRSSIDGDLVLDYDGPELESTVYANPAYPTGSFLFHHAEDEEAEVFFVGDAGGKGPVAAEIAVYLKGLIENETSRYKISGGSSWVNSALLSVNDHFLLKAMEGRFVVLNVILVWKKTGTVYLWNAGGAPIFHYRAENGELTKYELVKKPALGIFDSNMLEISGDGSGFGPQKLTLAEGDELLLVDESGREEFGEERVEAALRAVLNGNTLTIPAAESPEKTPWRLDFSGISTAGPKKSVLAVAAAEKLFRLFPSSSSDSSEARADVPAPARITGMMRAYIQRVVKDADYHFIDTEKDSESFEEELKNPSEQEPPSPDEENEQEKPAPDTAAELRGYMEYPRFDDLFAIAIRRKKE